MKKNKLYLEWLLKAQEDEKSVQILLQEKGPPNTICFHAHQIAEKCLKGFLIYHNKEFPKIHHLDLLLEMCLKVDKEFSKIKEEIFYLRPFYFETRYPGEYPQYNEKQARQSFEKAVKIKEFIINKISAKQSERI
ncbi:MAG: HEPN domain-containing protein [Patescibacteria group bacterium]|nr:HEPN domain-containing protein [Patescibacteria group bacterium]